MLEKSTFTVSLWKFKDGHRSERIEVTVNAVTADEAMKKAEKINIGYEAVAARVSGFTD